MSPSATRLRKLGVAVTMAFVLAVGLGAVDNPASHAGASTKTPTFRLAAMSPTFGATVDYRAPLRLRFSAAVDLKGPLPTVSSTPGRWAQLSPNVLEYEPNVPLALGQSVSVVFPTGRHGMESTAHTRLAPTASLQFQTAPLSTLDAQEILAELDYLPFSYSSASQAFTPRWSTLPAQLMSQWSPGQYNVLTKGAVMAFENAHNMMTDGVIGPTVSNLLLADASAHRTDPNPYNYVLVSQQLPESLQLWSNGRVLMTEAVNTGIPGSMTNVGTFPVYLRYQSQTMSGTNPDGSHYSDPGIPWVSYFSGGDALHGFLRASYGSPQSLGCVEMPFNVAGQVWPNTPIGTLVTVEPEA